MLGDRNLRKTNLQKLQKALFQTANDEFHVKATQNLDEDRKLLEMGFEYMTENGGPQVFRKRKES
jgi:hypothetical protein